MKRARQQRNLAGAVEFLRAYGGDPARWAAFDGGRVRDDGSQPTAEIAGMVVQALGELERTRGPATTTVFGPARP